MSLELLFLLAPAALLFAALLLGRYPGEHAIERARLAIAAPRPRTPAAARPEGPAALLPRGGRLLGSAIAARPPPACG